ncbi:MAG TPA: discoidin domain-containing protein, partial [Polyangiaceae bacterium]|nr:discoidin domain-containing protein [Polyangiaceae bacterium]
GGGGTGGGGSGDCETIPAKTGWTATASDFSNMCTDTADPLCNPADYAIDGSASTRFSTGAVQASGMWLQIDFGASTTVKQVVLTSSDTGDYPVGYAVTVSDTNENTAGTPQITGAGSATGTTTITLPSVATGQYLLIELTAASGGSWWSVHEVNVTCN